MLLSLKIALVSSFAIASAMATESIHGIICSGFQYECETPDDCQILHNFLPFCSEDYGWMCCNQDV